MTDRIDDGDGGDLLPEFEEIVAARNVLSRIIAGIENGVFGVLVSETDAPFLTLVPEYADEVDAVESPILYRVAEGGPSDTQVIENITDDLVNAKILLPDNRLKAVADAPKCKHELIDRHQATVLNADLSQQYHPNGAAVWVWCEGAPILRAAIKALTEESN